jgi:hypothetical protein
VEARCAGTGAAWLCKMKTDNSHARDPEEFFLLQYSGSQTLFLWCKLQSFVISGKNSVFRRTSKRLPYKLIASQIAYFYENNVTLVWNQEIASQGPSE